MADKNLKKKNVKKTGKKTSKTIAKKTSQKTLSKTAKKGKKAIKETAGKKTPLKGKPKAAQKSKKTIKSKVPKKPASKQSEEERKIALRRTLINKREEIVKEAKGEISKYIKGETRQLVDTALDDGDWSVIDLSEDVSLRQLSTHRQNLQKIDVALRKLDEGSYGSCEDCGEEISEERLKILPFAIYCIDCQEKREQLEEMERRERIG